MLFRWLKQHLKLRSFLGRSENAIRLRALAAMIAYVLLRIALRLCGYPMPVIRFARLVRDCLFARKALAEIDKPPDTYSPRGKPDPNQFLLEIS